VARSRSFAALEDDKDEEKDKWKNGMTSRFRKRLTGIPLGCRPIHYQPLGSGIRFPS
jgi:hypothetical protein